MSVQSIRQRTETKARSGGPRVDYHCHISMTEYSDIENPTLVSVTVEEFLADLDEAGIDVAIVLSDLRTTPEQVAAFVEKAPDRFIGFGYVNPSRRAPKRRSCARGTSWASSASSSTPPLRVTGSTTRGPSGSTRQRRASGCQSCSTTPGCPHRGTS